MTIAFIAGVLLAVAAISIKTGMILGSSWLTKKQIVLASIGFGVLLFLLAVMLRPYSGEVARLTEQYTFPASLVLSALFIYLGLTDHDSCSSCGPAKKAGHLAVFLPCPFCLLALVVSIILFKQQTGTHQLWAELVISVLLILALLVCSFATRHYQNKKGMSPMGTMNAMLLFFGFATLAMSLFIPNFVAAMQMRFSPITMDSWHMMGFTLLVLSGVSLTSFINRLRNNK